MCSHLGDELTEDIGALLAKKAPQVLDERLAEEYEALLAAVLEVDVEVVLLDALAVRAKFILDFRDELSFPRDLWWFY